MRQSGWALVLAMAANAFGAPPPKQQTPPLVTGASLYRAHCASCHGTDAKGGGPVADSMRMRPSDLTALKQRNNGVFPSPRLIKMMDGDEALPPHGSKRMPVWGPGLGAERTKVLIQYLESIQK